MANGWSLHLGLNSVDPGHYGGWSGPLAACEYDAEDMASIAKARGFKSQLALTKKGTRAALEAFLAQSAKDAQSGDIVWITYSGHGGQVPDWNEDEEDAQDETWCLYDGEYLDDELYNAWGRYRKGVRILVLSDSCHSGTVVRVAPDGSNVVVDSNGAAAGPAPRVMPKDVAVRTYRQNRKFYDKLQAKAGDGEDTDVSASVLLISGCQDNQLSRDGAFNGAFTGRLLQVWRDGKWKGSYRRFHKRIVKNMAADQTPNLFTVGAPNAAFMNEAPFSI